METKETKDKWAVAGLSLGALGVVYGDIGTSPLYTVKECFSGQHGMPVNEANILGVISLIVCSLVMVVCLKYLAFITKADNKGEGGIFALLAMISAVISPDTISGKNKRFIAVAAVFGAALLYGDGVITPAISVLSAVEGLDIVFSWTKPYIIPITCLILFSLFFIQHRGTHKIGKIFGWSMLVWFLVIGIIGFCWVIICPKILNAFNPIYAYRFFVLNGFHGFKVLGSVVLCITGGEALYADLGHFGRLAIKISWLGMAFPSLLCNYLGQGALLLLYPNLAANPFYGMVPSIFLLPMVLLATKATVIASQAMITGAFSLTQQAVQLGYMPRVRIVHTSADTKGQIYIPAVNNLMMVACLALVLAFKSSSGLAGAYGIAVTATMGITSIIYFFVVTKIWNWSYWKAVPLLAVFLTFDLAFFAANLLKFFDGGWFTIMIAIIILAIMMTWYKGRQILAEKRDYYPIKDFLNNVVAKQTYRSPRTAIVLSIKSEGVPVLLLHFLKHSIPFYEKTIILTVIYTEDPYYKEDRFKIEDLGQGFYRLLVFYGYMEEPDIPKVIQDLSESKLKINPFLTSYYFGGESIIISNSVTEKSMMTWRKLLFEVMTRNANSAAEHFRLPPGSVVVLGEQINI